MQNQGVLAEVPNPKNIKPENSIHYILAKQNRKAVVTPRNIKSENLSQYTS